MLGYQYWDIDYTIDPNRKYYVRSYICVYDVNILDNTFTNIDGPKGISKILQLNTYDDMLKFYDKYGYDIGKKYVDERIDWKKVYCDYGGIELAAGPLWDFREIGFYGHRWWYGWDISSGCIWNGELVNKIKWIA